MRFCTRVLFSSLPKLDSPFIPMETCYAKGNGLNLYLAHTYLALSVLGPSQEPQRAVGFHHNEARVHGGYFAGPEKRCCGVEKSIHGE